MEEFPLKIDKNNDQITIYDLAKHQNHGYEGYETRRLLEKYFIKEVNIKINIKKSFVLNFVCEGKVLFTILFFCYRQRIPLFKFEKKNFVNF